ncbi:MAG TPA: GTP-binding protein, partial [Acidimicrobiia bacterium]|nr:GTP-binding protein [Acidimicrobiia bacterium]
MRPQLIRNVALVGHSGSGKSTLAEALLFTAGVTTRMGRIEDGNTVTDFEPEEVSRGSSVSLAMAPFEWQGHKINLIDTPGYADFLGDVRAALRAVDLAIFVVSAVDGVEVQTEAIWRMAEEEGIARAVFINKLDRERSSYQRTVDELKAAFGTPIAPLQVPIGVEIDLRGVANLVG